MNIFGEENDSLWVIEGEYHDRGVGNCWFKATIVNEGHLDAVEFFPLVTQQIVVPGYYVSAQGKYLSTRRKTPKILDYTRKQIVETQYNGNGTYKRPLAFNASVPIGYMKDFDYVAKTNGQGEVSKTRANLNIRYHRGVKETLEPLDTHYFELGIPKEEWESSPTMAKIVRESAFVDHDNADTSDNNITNLKWRTPKGNSHHRKNRGLG